MSSDVLVLNRSLYAIGTTSWQRAVSLLYLDRANVIDDEYRTYTFDDWRKLSSFVNTATAAGQKWVRAASYRILIPEVIALKFYDRIAISPIKFTRKNIYEHYGYRCCYCNKKLAPAMLNLDHVVPRSRGGKTSWTNIVTACVKCNLRKGNRTPKEAGMRMLIQPTEPKGQGHFVISIRTALKKHASWQKFVDNIYWNVELEEEK
ncbi:MAG: HNH endonuclease [Elusimicrobiota bacterium]